MTRLEDPVLDMDKTAPDQEAWEQAAPDEAEGPEAVYGWCGLCRAFTDFPHECCGDDCWAEPVGSAAA